MGALHDLLQSGIDYAGLFPPAGLDMSTAAGNYAHYRAGAHRWALGRFVVPVSRLAELDAAIQGFPTGLIPCRPAGPAWPLAALLGTNLEADLEQLGEFNCRHAADGAPAVSADVVEFKASSAAAIETALRAMPSSVQAYVEIPIDHDPTDLVAAIARCGGRAKVRTGGVTPEAFPTTADLVRFIRRCEEAQLPFKATAGLHHPLRAEHRLTYNLDSPRGAMYGFLNLFLTAAFVLAGLDDADAATLLEERVPTAFRIDERGIEWRGHRLGLDAIANARERAIIAFGSCSFDEPIADLVALDWL
jgi:hypothetical protein